MNQPEPTLLAPHTHKNEVPLHGYMIVLIGTVVWALTGIVIKILLTQYALNTLTIAFWRVLIVAAFLFIVLLAFDSKSLRIAPRDLGIFFIYGLIGIGIHQLVWISSVQYNGAAVATVIIYTGPAIVGILAAKFLNEHFTRAKVVAIALTVLGCTLVAKIYDPGQVALNWLGIATGIGSAFTFATYSLIGRVLSRRYNAWTALFYAFVFGLVFLVPVVFLSGQVMPSSNFALDGWGWLVFLALVPTLGGFASYTIGLSHLPASVASILAAFEPVSTAIFAYLVFGEMLDPIQLVGAALILWSVILLRPKS